MTDKLKNYVSRNAFLAMIGLVIAMAVAVYVRHEKNGAHTVITNYRISQLEGKSKALQKKLYVLERSLVTLQHSLDADGDIPSLEGEENE